MATKFEEYFAKLDEFKKAQASVQLSEGRISISPEGDKVRITVALATKNEASRSDVNSISGLTKDECAFIVRSLMEIHGILP